jgi:hypothetical protein
MDVLVHMQEEKNKNDKDYNAARSIEQEERQK